MVEVVGGDVQPQLAEGFLRQWTVYSIYTGSSRTLNGTCNPPRLLDTVAELDDIPLRGFANFTVPHPQLNSGPNLFRTYPFCVTAEAGTRGAGKV